MTNVSRFIDTYLCALCVWALGFTVTASTAQAAVIYDNHATITSGGASDTTFPNYAADDFLLQPGANIVTGIRWTGLYAANVPPFLDLFFFQFYEDAGGVPAQQPLYQFVFGFSNMNRTDTGVDILGHDLYSYSVDLPPFTLAAGTTYWLSIYNVTSPDAGDNWYWGDGVGGNGAYRSSPSNAWLRSDAREDFQLIGTPEPTSMVLLGSGLAGVFLSRRRTRRAQ